MAAGSGSGSAARHSRCAPLSPTRPTTTTPAASADGIYEIDAYWPADRSRYYVVIGGVDAHPYCEVHMTLEGRRTGDGGHDYWGGGRTQVTIDVLAQYEADGYEAECS